MEQMDLARSIQKTVLQWMAANVANTGAELSRRSGVNTSDISHIKNGSFVRKVGKIESPIPAETYLKLAAALGVDVASNALHWENATIHRKLQETCQLAHQHRRFTLVDGMSGLGKTYSLGWYAKRNPKVVYIQATKNMTAVDLLSELLTKFGKARLVPKTGSRSKRIHELHRAIAEFVGSNPGWLVILDEMEDKSKELYQAVKDLCDDFGRERQHRKAGLLVCGIGLYETWQKKHLRGQMPFTQLYTRFTEHYKGLLNGTPDEKAAFLAQEVRKIAQEEGYTDGSAQNWLSAHIDNMGALNSLLTDLNAAVSSKQIPRTSVTAAVLDRFFKD